MGTPTDSLSQNSDLKKKGKIVFSKFKQMLHLNKQLTKKYISFWITF